MYRADINHPRLRKIESPEHLQRIQQAVESGDPDIFAQGPTSSSIDAAVAPVLGSNAIGHFRRWAVSGETSTLRANAVSILGFLPGRENADVVVSVLENDDVVRRLATKLAKEAVDPKDTEARWCAGYLLQRMAVVLGPES